MKKLVKKTTDMTVQAYLPKKKKCSCPPAQSCWAKKKTSVYSSANQNEFLRASNYA